MEMLKARGKDVAVCVFYGGIQNGNTKLTRNGKSYSVTNDEWNSSLYALRSRESGSMKNLEYEVLVVGDTNGHLWKQFNTKCTHDLNSNGDLYKNYLEENELTNLNVAKKKNNKEQNNPYYYRRKNYLFWTLDLYGGM